MLPDYEESVATSYGPSARWVEKLLYAEDWATILEVVPPALPRYYGHERARLHLALATALCATASSGATYQLALEHTLVCWRLAVPRTYLARWALQRLATLFVLMGLYRKAKRVGRRFLQELEHDRRLELCRPYALRDIFHAYFQRRQYDKAVKYCRKALRLFKAAENHEEILRTTCNLVWALVMSGRLAEAEAVLPKEAPPHMEHLLLGAKCILLFAQGQHDEASLAGQAALAATRELHDFGDGADVAGILKQIAKAQGLWELARSMQEKAIELLALQGLPELVCDLCTQVLVAPVIPSWPVAPSLIAGERSGACFTTGVA